MYAGRKSDESVVPATSANNGAAGAPAESIEERDSTKRNGVRRTLLRTQSRKDASLVSRAACVTLIRRDSRLKMGYSRPTQGRSRMR